MLKRLLCSSAFTLTILLPAAFAAPLTDGAQVSVTLDDPTFVGTELADTGALPFVTLSNANGTLEQLVYQEASGTLDFYYLVSNSSTSPENIVRITATNFTGFRVTVAFLAIGGAPPTEADRSVAGDTVGFDFSGPNNPGVLPGSNSDWVEISTDATAFALSGTSNVIDRDGNAGSVTTFSPITTPEPISMNLMGVGVAGFGLLGLRRRSAKKIFRSVG